MSGAGAAFLSPADAAAGWSLAKIRQLEAIWRLADVPAQPPPRRQGSAQMQLQPAGASAYAQQQPGRGSATTAEHLLLHRGPSAQQLGEGAAARVQLGASAHAPQLTGGSGPKQLQQRVVLTPVRQLARKGAASPAAARAEVVADRLRQQLIMR